MRIRDCNTMLFNSRTLIGNKFLMRKIVLPVSRQLSSKKKIQGLRSNIHNFRNGISSVLIGLPNYIVTRNIFSFSFVEKTQSSRTVRSVLDWRVLNNTNMPFIIYLLLNRLYYKFKLNKINYREKCILEIWPSIYEFRHFDHIFLVSPT